MGKKRILLTCFVVTFGAGLLWAQSGEPSLAEVAKYKPKKHAARVVTQDDIPPSLSLDTAGSSNDSGKSDEDEGEASDETKQRHHQPKDSQSRATTRSANASDDALRLQELKDQEARQKRLMQELKQQMETEESEFRRNVRRQMLENVQVHLENTARERQELEQKMADKKPSQGSSQPTSDDNPK